MIGGQKSMAEIEAKFLVEDPAQITQLVDSLQAANLEVQALPAVDVVDRYLDTPDWQVLREGWAYRWRDASGKRKVGLKSVALNGGAVQKREEVEQPVAKLPGKVRRLPKGPVAQKLSTVRRKKLHELFQVHNHRCLFNVRTPQGALLELAIDRATITATVQPACRMEFQELEIELKEGTEETLQELAAQIREQFGLLPSRLSKFERGIQATGQSPPSAQLRREVRWLEDSELANMLLRPLRKQDAAVVLAYRHLCEQFKEMICQEPRAWEGLDPEGVHQMRVATRRIRAALRAFRQVLPGESRKTFNGEFKWLAAVLGDVRDLDVHQENFQHYTVEVPEAARAYCQQHLAEQWRQARKQLLVCLSSHRYDQLKASFTEFLQRGPLEFANKTTGSLTIGEAARKAIGKQYKAVLRDGRAIKTDSPDEALHTLRIDCKRLRYLFEFFDPIYGKALSSWIKRSKKLQDVLGDFQDACVATERLHAYADSVPMLAENRDQLVAVGQLIHSQRLQAASKRADFRKIWKRFDRAGDENQIRKILQRA
jgi:CHAD domain-containing protein